MTSFAESARKKPRQPDVSFVWFPALITMSSANPGLFGCRSTAIIRIFSFRKHTSLMWANVIPVKMEDGFGRAENVEKCENEEKTKT